MRLRIRDREHGRRTNMAIIGETVHAVKRAFFQIVEISQQTAVRQLWIGECVQDLEE